ncbi:heme/hemin ABC transporter substrate-binding protein [Persicimonas caeni]|nr:ABC transporter substrate-binding protein [Persicimonas caeni]
MSMVNDMTRKGLIWSACLVLLGAGMLGCDKSAPASEKGVEQGAEASAEAAKENPVEEPAEKQRIVSLGGTVTEIVYALGAGDAVVAVDKSSVYPEATEELRTLDLFRTVSAEAVLSHEPTLVVATDAANPDGAFERIEKAGVKVLRLTADETVDAAKARISKLGEALGKEGAAKELLATLDAELAEAKSVAEACDKPAKALFMYARGRGTTFVAGKDTSASRMIELAGATHVPGNIEGFKPMTAEAVLEANPDTVLMTGSGLKSMGGVEGLRGVKGLSETAAVEEGRVVTMGDLELLGFGPRTGQAAAKLAKKLCLDEAQASNAAE